MRRAKKKLDACRSYEASSNSELESHVARTGFFAHPGDCARHREGARGEGHLHLHHMLSHAEATKQAVLNSEPESHVARTAKTPVPRAAKTPVPRATIARPHAIPFLPREVSWKRVATRSFAPAQILQPDEPVRTISYLHYER